MKFTKTIDIIKLLQEQGENIKYRKRTDGGYIITSINGIKYTGAKGNNIARQMTGQALTDSMKFQRAKITDIREKSLKEIEEKDVKRQMIKSQRAWAKYKREGGTADKSRITISQVKKSIKKYGAESTLKWLSESEKYSKGFSYTERVKFLKERLERESSFSDKENKLEWDKILSYLDKNQGRIREIEQTQKIFDLLYDFVNGLIVEGTFLSQVKQLLNIKDDN